MTRQDVDKKIIDIAHLLGLELQKLHERVDWTTWKESQIQVRVCYSKDKGPRLELFWFNPAGADVKAKSLGRLMDEVYHRLDFDEREAGIEPLKALNAPSSDDEVQF